MMNQEDLELAKQQPYYKSIVRSFLQKQIQFLLDQMSYEVGEESVIMTVNLRHGTMSHLGTRAGNAFIEDMGDVKTMFQNYCLSKFSEGMFDTPDIQVQDFFGNKRTNQAKSFPAPKRLKKTHKGKSTSKTIGVSKKQDDFSNEAVSKRENEDEMDTPYELGMTGTDETSRLSDGGEVCQENRANEFDLFFKNSYNPASGDNSGNNETETSQTSTETADNVINQGASSSEYTESNCEFASFAEQFVNNVVKIEPGTEDEQPAEQPTYNYVGSSNKYMGTDGVVVSISKAGSVIRHKNPLCKGEEKKRQLLTIAEKYHILEDIEAHPHLSFRQLAKRNQVGRSTITLIAKNKAFYRNQYEIHAESPRKRLGPARKYNAINDLVYSWYTDARNSGLVVSGPMVREKALEFAKELNLTDFKGSNGWLASWQSRFNIKTFKLNDDEMSNAIQVSDWTSNPPETRNEDSGAMGKDTQDDYQTSPNNSSLPDSALPENTYPFE